MFTPFLRHWYAGSGVPVAATKSTCAPPAVRLTGAVGRFVVKPSTDKVPPVLMTEPTGPVTRAE